MDVKEAAFRRAALLLSTIGATYAIVYSGKEHTSGGTEFALRRNGNTYGTLVPVKVAKPRNNWLHTGYNEALKLLGPAEAWEYQCKTKDEATAMQRAVTGEASRLWGKGAYISTVKNGNTLEILRLE